MIGGHSGCSPLIGQERKAAKTLSAILLVFILTWTPYNVLAVMKETHTSATRYLFSLFNLNNHKTSIKLPKSKRNLGGKQQKRLCLSFR